MLDSPVYPRPPRYSGDRTSLTDNITRHGTMVTSIIAARRNNGLGMASIGYGVSIRPMIVVAHDNPNMRYVARAINHIASGHPNYYADVINMSLATPHFIFQDHATFLVSNRIISTKYLQIRQNAVYYP